MTRDNLLALRKEMKKRKIDLYIMTVSDFHSSEYIGDYFKEIAFLTGFTGENSWVAVSENEAHIWADGRYFLQCERQIAGSGFKMIKIGVDGEPTVEEYLKKRLKDGMTLGFDGRLFTYAAYKKYKDIADAAGAKVTTKYNLIDGIWKDRPMLSCEPVWVLKPKFSGRSLKSKVKDVLSDMRAKDADGFLLTSLYDIAWLLNLRGDDIPCVPVFMSYFFLTTKKAVLYIQKKALSPKVKEYLKKNQITIKAYEEIYKDLPKEKVSRVLYDPNIVNERLVSALPKKCKRLEDRNPTELKKAIKNETEIENTKEAHIKDGVAVTKFIYWLKHNIGKEEITELSAAAKINSLRSEQEGFLDLSFDTISAYRENAAMMHYSATPESFAVLKDEGFLLVDSGGHYLEGTTDITRTIALGALTDREKEAFTLTLKAHLRLMGAHFVKGVTGQNLDVLSRGIMWDRGLDYRCGTGHGVGHILNVHEGPNGFRWKIDPQYPAEPIVPGMITTDEPGLYYDGELGVRIENELLCVEDVKTEYGQFYRFENITFAPIERDAIITSLLTDEEKAQLNEYHALVREKISPFLTADEAKWLKEVTAEI